MMHKIPIKLVSCLITLFSPGSSSVRTTKDCALSKQGLTAMKQRARKKPRLIFPFLILIFLWLFVGWPGIEEAYAAAPTVETFSVAIESSNQTSIEE